MYTGTKHKDEKKVTRKRMLLVVSVPFIVAILVQLLVVNTAPGAGGELARIERETISVQREANVLKAEIASASSLQRLSKEAESQGLVQPKLAAIYMDLERTADGSQKTNLIGNAGQ